MNGRRNKSRLKRVVCSLATANRLRRVKNTNWPKRKSPPKRNKNIPTNEKKRQEKWQKSASMRLCVFVFFSAIFSRHFFFFHFWPGLMVAGYACEHIYIDFGLCPCQPRNQRWRTVLAGIRENQIYSNCMKTNGWMQVRMRDTLGKHDVPLFHAGCVCNDMTDQPTSRRLNAKHRPP